jgi:hypothetical protein
MSDTQAAQLAKNLEVVAKATPHTAPTLFAMTIHEHVTQHEWIEEECAFAFRAYASAQRETKQMLVTDGWKGCDASCPPRYDDAHPTWKAIWAADAAERTATLLRVCDAEGPDPVFGGGLAKKRGSMDWIGYMVTRHGFELAQQRVGDRPALQALLDQAKGHVAEGLSIAKK